MGETLDVGCGQRQLGTVNIDVNKPLALKPNAQFVRLDLDYGLPFIGNCFETVYCYHVIEHVKNPVLLLNELILVSYWHVEIRCPWRFSGYAKVKKKRGHIHTFNKTGFIKILILIPDLGDEMITRIYAKSLRKLARLKR